MRDYIIIVLASLVSTASSVAQATPPRPALPEGWNGSTDWLTIENTGAHQGSKCVKVAAWTKEPGYAWIVSERIPAKPGAEYTIAAWVKSKGNSDVEDFLAIRWHESNTYLGQEGPVIPADAGSWTEVTGSSTCPDNATHVDVALFFRSKEGMMWLDNVSLKVEGNDRELVKNGSFEVTRDSPEDRPHLPVSVTANIESHSDLEFARYGERSVKLDLFRPKDRKGKLPAIVCIHGGAWQKGEKSNFRLPAMAVAARGFVTVSIEYRLSDESPFPAQIEDCKAAVRWLRANAETYGIDHNHVGAIGYSAGGHLAALLATSGGVPELEGDGGNSSQSSNIQAAVVMAGQTDLMTDHVRRESASERGEFWRKFLGGNQIERREVYRLASPIHHFDESDAPLYLITGEHDERVTRGEDIRKRMKESRIPTGLTIIGGATHGLLENSEWCNRAIELASNFFVSQLASDMDEPKSAPR
jgi:pectinesterase